MKELIYVQIFKYYKHALFALLLIDQLFYWSSGYTDRWRVRRLDQLPITAEVERHPAHFDADEYFSKYQ
jgi:hypothetical protein